LRTLTQAAGAFADFPTARLRP